MKNMILTVLGKTNEPFVKINNEEHDDVTCPDYNNTKI